MVHTVERDSETEYSSDCSSIASVTANESVNTVNNESGPIYCEMLLDDSSVKLQTDWCDSKYFAKEICEWSQNQK